MRKKRKGKNRNKRERSWKPWQQELANLVNLSIFQQTFYNLQEID